MLGLTASFVAGISALVASQTADEDLVPFFIGLSFLGGVDAWAAREPSAGWERTVARSVAVLWLIAAVWVGVLLGWEALYYGASRPTPEPGRTFLALPVTVYHLLGLYGGAALVTWSAFGPRTRGREAPEGAASAPPRSP